MHNEGSDLPMEVKGMGGALCGNYRRASSLLSGCFGFTLATYSVFLENTTVGLLCKQRKYYNNKKTTNLSCLKAFA